MKRMIIDGMIRFNEHDVSIQPGESYEGYSVFEIFEGRDYVSFEFRGDEYLVESSEEVLIMQEHANWELD
jgi:predicted HAD superfamily phosphohydrolase